MAHPTSDKRTQHLHLPRLAVTDYVGLCREATGNNHALLLSDAAAASGYERQVVNIREKFKVFSTYIVSYLSWKGSDPSETFSVVFGLSSPPIKMTLWPILKLV